MLSSADRFAGLCERLVIGMWMAPLVEGAADEELARNERARSMCGSMMVVEKGGGSERNARGRHKSSGCGLLAPASLIVNQRQE